MRPVSGIQVIAHIALQTSATGNTFKDQVSRAVSCVFPGNSLTVLISCVLLMCAGTVTAQPNPQTPVTPHPHPTVSQSPLALPDIPAGISATQEDHTFSGGKHNSQQEVADSIPIALWDPDERCGTVEVNEALRRKYGVPSVNEFEQWMKEQQRAMPDQRRMPTIITIPVVVHVIHNGEAVGELPNISDAQIQSQIDVLNEDFRRMNADAVNTPAVFSDVAADVELEFCLATVDPEGNPTSGITRYNGNKPNYSIDDLENVIKPNTIWHPDYYFNIWCAPLQGGLLGYAQFPDNSTLPGFLVNGGPAITDGIVVRDIAFGVGGTASPPVDLGRVATHEAGHFFGLRHLGGDGDCNADDFCNDTPGQNGQNGFYQSCVFNPLASGAPRDDCDDGPGDLPDQFMNYMDYSDDACMNLFTQDQKARVAVVMTNSPRRASLANSQVCEGIPPSTTFVPFPYAPENDLCFNAEPINCDETQLGNTLFASPHDIPLACDVTAGGSGVWYKFTGDGDFTTLSLCGSGFDTKINVYSGDCGNMVCVAGNDDACGLQSVVSFFAETDTVYSIYISGFNGQTGAYRLSRTCGTNSGTALGSASNIYSGLLTQQNQVYASDSLDLVVFIHRQNIAIYGGDNGVLRYDISTNGGLTFNNDIGILNALNTHTARYPQITGFRTSGSTDPFDHKLIWAAPTVQGTQWWGMANGAADITDESPVTSTEHYNFNTEPSYLGAGLCEGLPGEFWLFDQSLIGNVPGDSFSIQKGVYNPVTEDVEWSMYEWILPEHYTGYDGTARIGRSNISFSPDGNHGWAAFLGDLVGGPDSTFNPVFIPTTDGGDTWGAPIEVDLTAIEYIGDTTGGISTLMEALQEGLPGVPGRPTCGLEFDLTVDSDGNPHMFVVVGNARPDYMTHPSYTLYSDLPMLAVDIYSEDDGLTWTALQIAPISVLQWTIGIVNSTTMNNNTQVSRTHDGTHIFYSWMDTDEPAGDLAPNLRISSLRLSDNTLTCPKWITPGGPLDGYGFYPTMSPEVLITESETGFKLPIVMALLNASGDPNMPVQYMYMGNSAVIHESDYLFDFESIDYASCEPAPDAPTDEFGYSYEDCASTSFAWVDITTKPGAVETTGLADDNSIGPFPIGFDFRYYWSDQTQFYIGSNGWVGFNEGSALVQCFPVIPTPGGSADNFLAPYLSDLNFDGDGNPATVWYWSNQADTLIISYLNVPYWMLDAPGYTGSNSFQVILTGQDSNITFQYLETDPGFNISDMSDACNIDLQIGIENSSGHIGLLAGAESAPDDSCALRFVYPDSSLYAIFDAGVLWNQNSNNRVEIVDLGESVALQAETENLGNLDMSDIIVHGELVNNGIPASIFTTLDTIPGLTSGQSTIQNLHPGYSFNEIGNFSLTVDLISNEDTNPNNNTNTSEILVIDCLQETVKLDYNTSDNVNSGLGWSGDFDRDLYGGAVFFDPPGEDFRLDSVEAIVWQNDTASDQTITIKVIQNDGPPGMGTVLFDTILLKTEYPSLVPFTIPVGGLDVGQDGFYIYWGGDENTYVASSAAPPFSRAAYEVVNGNWAEYRFNNTYDLHLRAYGSCQPYPFAPANDLCANAQFVNCMDTLVGTTVGASPIGQPAPCVADPDGPGVWYRFIGDGALATLSFSQVTFDANVTVYSGNCSSMNCVNGIAINNGQSASMDFTTIQGVNYYIYVSGSPEDFGTFTIARTGACMPCPLSISTEASSNSPICTNGELLLSVEVTGDGPFYYAWSGPAQTWINGNTATPAAYGVSSGVFSVTVTNDCGAEVVSSTQVVVSGPPEITVLGPLLLPVDPGLCGAVVNGAELFPLVTATGIPEPQITIPVNSDYPVGLSGVTATASNVCGSDQGTIDVYVIDNVPPVAMCRDLSIELTDGSAIITLVDLDAGSSDACGLQSILINGTDSLLFHDEDAGFHHITMTVSDVNGNQSSCLSVVHVVRDLCVDGSDFTDSDHGGLPDACDCSPFDDFNDRIALTEDINVGMDFDGVNDYLALNDPPGFAPSASTSITLEAWIKPDLTKQFNTIISRGPLGNSTEAYIFNTFDYTNVGLYLARSWFSGDWYVADITLTPDVWTHVAVTYNHQDSMISFYHNGSLVNQIPVLYGYSAFDPESEFPGSVVPVHIGFQGLGCNCNYYKGQMDEVRVWNTAHTESQLQALIDKELKGNEAGLVGYYNFNKGIPGGDNTGLTQVMDRSQYLNHATLSGFAQNGNNSNWVSDTLTLVAENTDTRELCLTCPGSQGIGMSFDGTDDYFSVPNHPDLIPTATNEVTFEGWIFPEGDPDVSFITSSGSWPDRNHQIYLYDNKLWATGTGVSALISSATIPSHEWTHIAVVYDLTETRMYINGELDTVRVETLASDNLGFDVTFGNQANGDPSVWSFLGIMEEMRIWNEARSQEQIQALMHRELHGDESNLAAYYDFNSAVPQGDNMSLTTIADASPNGRDGTPFGFAQTGDSSNWVSTHLLLSGQDNVVLDFDGIDDEVFINHDTVFNPVVGSSFSFEAWINPASGQTAQTILSKGTGSGGQNAFLFSIFQDKIALFMADGTQATWMYANTDITFNAWNHVAVVYDGLADAFTFYLNGVADGQTSLPHGFYSDNSPLYIGRQGTVCDCNHFLGQMDEVRIWSEARSASQIQAFMHQALNGSEPGLEAYYTFNNGIAEGDNSTVQTIPDASLNGRDGMVVDFAKTGNTSNWVGGGFAIAGPQNASLHFDGTDDYITIPNHPDLIPTATNAVTFEAWIHPGGDSGESILTASGIWPDRNHLIYLLGSSLLVTGTGVSALVSTDTIPFHTWTHIAVAFDMTETRLYINGELNNTRVETLTASNLGYDVSLGNQAGGDPSDWNYLGIMDDVRYWDHARTASEIAERMDQELTGNEEGLAAYYNFNEGIPAGDNTGQDMVYDLTGNGHDGTVHGFVQMGNASNWVSSPFNFGDSDRDGVPDFCDNCVPLKDLLLANQALQGIYRASENIILGPGLTLPMSGAIELRAPTVQFTEILPDLPAGTSWLVTPHVCPNE